MIFLTFKADIIHSGCCALKGYRVVPNCHISVYGEQSCLRAHCLYGHVRNSALPRRINVSAYSSYWKPRNQSTSQDSRLTALCLLLICFEARKLINVHIKGTRCRRFKRQSNSSLYISVIILLR